MGLEQQIIYYRRARTHLLRAIEYDEQKQYSNAIDSYSLVCENLFIGLKYDKYLPTRKRTIRQIQDYLGRAEYIQQQIRSNNTTKLSNLKSDAKNRTLKDSNIEQNNKNKMKGVEDVKGINNNNLIGNGFDSVAGLKNVKTALKEAVILPMFHPQLFSGKRKPWKGILLYGPPGTGKSHIARALSKEAACSFFSLSSSDIVSKYQGESEKAVRKIFEVARKSKPCVIFLDEIDSIGRSRSDSVNESSRRLLTELLKQLDGIGSDMKGITLIGATNHPEEIDSALRRRFEKRIYVPMPGPKARAKILKLCLGDDQSLISLNNSDFDEIAKRSSGYSGSDISSVANEALMIPVRNCMKSTHFKFVNQPLSGKNKQEGWFSYLKKAVNFSTDEINSKILIPCSSWDPLGQKMHMMDSTFPADKLVVPPVSKADVLTALTKVKPSVDQSELQKYADFAALFGDKDIIKDFEDDEMEVDVKEFKKQKHQSVVIEI